jgi:Domain of unknown function (DUF4845)
MAPLRLGEHRSMINGFQGPRRQRGITLFGLLTAAVVLGFAALIAMRVLPTVNEYFTIVKAVNKAATEGGTTVPEIRAAFERSKQIEYSITSISGKDLDITKVNDKIVVSFAYDKEIELMPPVYLLIKYEGQSK